MGVALLVNTSAQSECSRVLEKVTFIEVVKKFRIDLQKTAPRRLHNSLSLLSTTYQMNPGHTLTHTFFLGLI
jgi:hypothetical protein